MCDTPCKKSCPDRNATCHATCEKYKQFQKEREEFRESRMKQIMIDNYYGDLSVDISTGGFANRRKRGQRI